MRVINGQGNVDLIDHYKIIKEESISLNQYLERIESDIISNALADVDENISSAAKILKITRQGLQYKINKLSLDS